MKYAWLPLVLVASSCGESLPEVEITGWDAIACVTTDRPGVYKDFTCTSSISLRTTSFDPATRFARTRASIRSSVGAFYGGMMLLEEQGPSFSGNQGLSVALEESGAVYDETQCTPGTDTAGKVHVLVEEQLDGDAIAAHSDTREVAVTLICQ